MKKIVFMLVLLFSFSIVIGTSGFPVNAFAADLPIFPGAHGLGWTPGQPTGGARIPPFIGSPTSTAVAPDRCGSASRAAAPESASLKFPGLLSHRQTWWPVSRI